jgi:hypothetical protein
MAESITDDALTSRAAWHILSILILVATVLITIKHDQVVAVSQSAYRYFEILTELTLRHRNYGLSLKKCATCLQAG